MVVRGDVRAGIGGGEALGSCEEIIIDDGLVAELECVAGSGHAEVVGVADEVRDVIEGIRVHNVQFF